MKNRKLTYRLSSPRSFAHRIEDTEGRMKELLMHREAVIRLLADLEIQMQAEDPLHLERWTIEDIEDELDGR